MGILGRLFRRAPVPAEEPALEPGAFNVALGAPQPDPEAAYVSEVKMLRSYGDLPAGETFVLPCDVADRLILKGAADGKLSRAWTPEEQAQVRAGVQTVHMGSPEKE